MELEEGATGEAAWLAAGGPEGQGDHVTDSAGDGEGEEPGDKTPGTEGVGVIEGVLLGVVVDVALGEPDEEVVGVIELAGVRLGAVPLVAVAFVASAEGDGEGDKVGSVPLVAVEEAIREAVGDALELPLKDPAETGVEELEAEEDGEDNGDGSGAQIAAVAFQPAPAAQ